MAHPFYYRFPNRIRVRAWHTCCVQDESTFMLISRRTPDRIRAALLCSPHQCDICISPPTLPSVSLCWKAPYTLETYKTTDLKYRARLKNSAVLCPHYKGDQTEFEGRRRPHDKSHKLSRTLLPSNKIER